MPMRAINITFGAARLSDQSDPSPPNMIWLIPSTLDLIDLI